MNAIGYARTSRYEKEPIPVEVQRDQIRTFAQCNGYELIAFYNDDRISGKSIDARKGLTRVLECVATKSIDTVIVYSFKKLFRNNFERRYISRLFVENGAKCLSCTEEGFLPTGSIGKEPLDLMLLIFKLREREANSQRARQRIQLKRESGERLGSNTRYGYRVVDRELVEDQDEQRLVQRVRQLKQRGEKTKSITEIVNNENFRTRKGTLFGCNQILRIIKALPVEEINI